MTPSNKWTKQQVLNLVMAILVPILTLLVGLDYLAPDPAPDEPTARGTTNFDDIVLSGDLTVGDDLDVTGSATFGSGNLSALLSDTDGQVVFVAERSVTGTATIGTGVHGVDDITAAFCTMGQTPSTGAGAAALCWVDFGATGNLTITVEQDDWTTNASVVAVIEYLVVGTP